MNNLVRQPVEREISATGSRLYIFFGGIAAQIAMPPFEFYNSSKILDENKIFIRDFAQCWYQDGLPGIGRDIDATAKYIDGQISEIRPEKTFFVGNSMGGYAAILFAGLLGKGEAIAFAPQTFISPALRLKHLDYRWPRQIFRTYRRSFRKRKIWDLRPLLLGPGGARKIAVYVSRGHRLDHVHAAHVKDIAGVRVHEFESGGHGVVKVLRDAGKLPAIMSGTYTRDE